MLQQTCFSRSEAAIGQSKVRKVRKVRKVLMFCCKLPSQVKKLLFGGLGTHWLH